MIGEQVAFGLLALVTLGGALFAVTAKRTFHATLGLAATLLGVAALFIQMGSPFIGVMQVLVYVGGILTLLIFAVMFVAGDETEEEFEVRP